MPGFVIFVGFVMHLVFAIEAVFVRTRVCLIRFCRPTVLGETRLSIQVIGKSHINIPT